MDRILRSTFVLILLMVSAIPVYSQQADGIAAIVDGQVITFSQVRRQVESTEKLLRDTYAGQELVDKVKEARLSALRALIERQLIIQDFKKQGFFIPDSLIEDRLKDTIQRSFEGDRTAFIRTLQAQGLTVEGYKKELKDNLIVTAMRQKNVSSAVIVSPFKIEQYYQDEKGVIIATGTENGFKTFGLSANFDYLVRDNVMFRIEARNLSSKDEIFLKDGNSTSSNTFLTTSLAISF